MPNHARIKLIACSLTAAFACKKPTPAVVATPTVVDAGVATTSAPPTPPSTPAVVDVPSGTPLIAPIPEPVGENLIQRLHLTATASSTIAGTANTLAMMTDGNPATAWNSRTGDLIGGWFQFTVPAGISVQSFSLTPGFTHRTGRTDLFAGNHRISQVRVTRDNVLVGEFGLNAELPESQVFPLSGDGGTYRITVTGVIAGTRPTWRELCVSEFAIYGTVPEGFVVPEQPEGGADQDASADESEDGGDDETVAAGVPSTAEQMGRAEPETLTPIAPVASVDAYCRTAMLAGYRRRQCTDATTANGIAACFCGQMSGTTSPAVSLTGRGSLQRPAGPFLGAYVMARTNNPAVDVQCDVLVRTPGGLYPIQDVASCGAPTANGSVAGSLPALDVRTIRATNPDGGTPELNITWRTTKVDPNYSAARCTTTWNVRCAVDAANVPSCVQTQTEDWNCVVPPPPEQPE